MPDTTASRTRWVHTGIEAPYTFAVTGFKDLDTGRGIAYSAELVHPDLGVVGRIANEGCGGPTTFYSHNRSRFGEDHLELFLRQCRQDGEPMDAGHFGMETLLDAIIDEAETADTVAEMRSNSHFLVRSYLPREAAPWGPRRGAPLANTRILLRRAARERLIARLARMPAERLEDGAYWQMFDGAEWTRMLGESPLTPAQSNTRVHRAEQLAAEAPGRDTFLGVVPFDEEFYLTGRPATAFTLTGDTDPILRIDSWCPCSRRRSTVRFERWSGTGLEESGTVHAAQGCRRLVRID